MAEVLVQDQVFVMVDNLILTVRQGRLNLLLSRRKEFFPCYGNAKRRQAAQL
jgi:hypothetical protein